MSTRRRAACLCIQVRGYELCAAYRTGLASAVRAYENNEETSFATMSALALVQGVRSEMRSGLCACFPAAYQQLISRSYSGQQLR